MLEAAAIKTNHIYQNHPVPINTLKRKKQSKNNYKHDQNPLIPVAEFPKNSTMIEDILK